MCIVALIVLIKAAPIQEIWFLRHFKFLNCYISYSLFSLQSKMYKMRIILKMYQ